MAVYNQNPDNYEHTYFVGMAIGELEIIQLTAISITAVCSCGNQVSRSITAFQTRPPYSCKQCAKEARANESFRTSTAISIREYDAVESLMIKEASSEPLTLHEKQVLAEHREKATKKSRIKAKTKQEKTT